MRLTARSVLGRRRNSAFAHFIGALHFSRRIEARRLLRRHRHLIADAPHGPSNNFLSIADNSKESEEHADRNNAHAHFDRRTFQDA
jgi:hypothetical protein